MKTAPVKSTLVSLHGMYFDGTGACGATVERLTGHFPKGTPDEKWLAEAGRKRWVVLTRDKRIRYRQLERLALHEAGVRAFVFTGGNVTIKDTGAILASALKHMSKIAHADPGPFIYHISRLGKPVRMGESTR